MITLYFMLHLIEQYFANIKNVYFIFLAISFVKWCVSGRLYMYIWTNRNGSIFAPLCNRLMMLLWSSTVCFNKTSSYAEDKHLSLGKLLPWICQLNSNPFGNCHSTRKASKENIMAPVSIHLLRSLNNVFRKMHAAYVFRRDETKTRNLRLDQSFQCRFIIVCLK